MGFIGELITAENAILAAVIWLIVRLEWTRSDVRTLVREDTFHRWKIEWLMIAVCSKLGIEPPFKPWPPSDGPPV